MLKKEDIIKLASDSLTEQRFIERNSHIFNRAKIFDILTILMCVIYFGASYYYLNLTQMIFFCVIPLAAYFMLNNEKDFKNPLTYTSYFENFIIKEMDKKYGINLECVDLKFENFYERPLEYIEQYLTRLDLDEIEFASIYYIEKLRLDPENREIKRKLDVVVEKIKNRKKMFEENVKHYRIINELGVNIEHTDHKIIKGD